MDSDQGVAETKRMALHPVFLRNRSSRQDLSRFQPPNAHSSHSDEGLSEGGASESEIRIGSPRRPHLACLRTFAS
jgi:hypothetical protein